MKNQRQKLSLKDLVDQFQSQNIQNDENLYFNTLSLIFTHGQIKYAIKNQSEILKKIFTYRSLKILISFLKEENQQHLELLKTIKFDPSGEFIPLQLKLPFMSMEILTSQCQIINTLLFQGTTNNPKPLLPELMLFLDHSPHYHLASYFSKVICAITKRVYQPSHKYNQTFSNWVFGMTGQQDQSYLYKTIGHLYSLTTIEYITKWLLLNSNDKIQNGQTTQIVKINIRKLQKQNFLLNLINIIHHKSIHEDCYANIPQLFEQMLLEPEKSTKLASTFLIKSISSNKNISNKLTLYDLAANEQIVNAILQKPQESLLTLAKINLVKTYIKRYAAQIQMLKKEQDQDKINSLKLIQLIDFEQLSNVVKWIFEAIQNLMNVNLGDSSNDSYFKQQNETIDQSRVKLHSNQKLMVLHLLEILRMIHSMQNCRMLLAQYYNSNSNILVRAIKRLMCLENNLIQIQTSKIILIILRSKQQQKSQTEIPFDFARKLLTQVIIKLLEVSSARCHVIEWADIILSYQKQHIFEDYQQQFQWQNIRQIVQSSKDINLGQFRLVQSSLDYFYSEQNALLKYSNFLNDFTPLVIYQDKKEVKEVKIQNVNSSLLKSSQKSQISIERSKDQKDVSNENQIVFSQLSDKEEYYLHYDINNLISQL